MSEPGICDRLAKLASDLEDSGNLRSRPWRDAVLATPRHPFVSGFYRSENTPAGTVWTPVTPAIVGDAAYLDLVYANDTLVTQLNGHTPDWDTATPVSNAVPTSSSTLPGLVVLMLEELDLADGMRLLEIGTGTGYSTALVSQRLGDDCVTSIEYDQEVHQQAAAALHQLGHHPTLITGDGALGHPGAAPYDRIIATCSFRNVPPAWLVQSAPAAKILTTFNGTLWGTAMATLTVTGHGTATGYFHPGTISFMISRPQQATGGIVYPRGMFAEDDATISYLNPAVFTEPTFRFLLQTAFPRLRTGRIRAEGDEDWIDVLAETGTSHWATYRSNLDGTLLIRQNGDLWTRIEHNLAEWDHLGRPSIDQFQLTITPSEQRISIPGQEPAWYLS
jgi:methyltransferase of ATP-grasp peptide maturase system